MPTDVPLAREISRAKIGIVWHTTYSGTSFETMKASFGQNIANSLTQSNAVWSVDAEYKDVSGNATMTKRQTKAITGILSNAGKTFNKIDAAGLNGISDNAELLQRMKTFLNTKVRKQQKVTNVKKKAVAEMIDYFHDYYQIESDKKKVALKGKADVDERKREVMKYFSQTNRDKLRKHSHTHESSCRCKRNSNQSDE